MPEPEVSANHSFTGRTWMALITRYTSSFGLSSSASAVEYCDSGCDKTAYHIARASFPTASVQGKWSRDMAAESSRCPGECARRLNPQGHRHTAPARPLSSSRSRYSEPAAPAFYFVSYTLLYLYFRNGDSRAILKRFTAECNKPRLNEIA